MARLVNRLTAKHVASIKEPGRHADGAGLYLVVDPNGAKRWAFLFRWKDDPSLPGTGRLREMGLGSASIVSLAEAREATETARRLSAQGVDPIAARRPNIATKVTPTFGEEADAYLTNTAPRFRNPKHAAQWATTLGKTPYDIDKVRIDRGAHNAHVAALTALRSRPVDQIEATDVLTVLMPIWHAAPETAARVRGRIERILDAAKVKGLRSGDNPARWKGHMELLLSRRSKNSRGHHSALPWPEVPNAVARLRAVGGVSASALEFAILTAARTGEALGARWPEFDLTAKVWTVPADRMKGERVHRVPLTERALSILAAMRSVRHDDTGYAFPGQRRGKPLSQMALAMALRRLDIGEATVHGFRSSFRDWVGEATDFPGEIAEAALAHVVGDATEAAYRRGDALEKRRLLMLAWAQFCEPKALSDG